MPATEGDWRNTFEKRPVDSELNPPTSSLHHSQAVEIAKETGLCSDGRPCGENHAFFDDYCDDCPNNPCNCDGCTDGEGDQARLLAAYWRKDLLETRERLVEQINKNLIEGIV